MIGREYFETELPAQIEAAGRPLAVTLVVRDGGSLRVDLPTSRGGSDQGWPSFAVEEEAG